MTTMLLSSVFGPFGVDDAYGRKKNVMELFHNQVTREQGMFSLRFNHPSFGLHLLAENVLANTRVLDFPSQKRFVRELKNDYDYVGISFIAPNFAKAQRMAQLVRQHAPRSKIILGGHGTRIPDIEKLVEHDHICSSEGVRWLRELLGEDPDRAIKHPHLASAIHKKIVGVPRPIDAAVLIPGVGCANACRFCATSHFFDRSYTPYLSTGDELYQTCVDIENKLGMREFFVMDENFLKQRERAERLLELMQRNNKPYSFGLFSSAETIRNVGVEFLQRLGVYFLWLGVESKREVYEKNRGVDFHALIAELRNAGITVLASGILFLEHHDPVSIQEDIDFMVSLEADFVQFMQLGPLPRTELYESYKRQGLLREDIPYADWHGQDKIWFKHQHFSREQSEQLITDAFMREYSVNGPSILRLFETAVRGARHIQATDPWMQQRRQQLIARCNEYRPMLKVIELFAKTDLHRAQARRVQDLYTDLLGAETAKQKAFTVAATAFSAKEWLREKLGALCYQPPTMVNDYKAIPTAKASLLSQAELMLSGVQQTS